MGLNHYTTFFTLQSKKESPSLLDTGVTNVVDESYPTTAADWLQVSRQGTAEGIIHIGLSYLCIYMYMYVCVCVCVCVRVFIGILYSLKFSFV